MRKNSLLKRLAAWMLVLALLTGTAVCEGVDPALSDLSGGEISVEEGVQQAADQLFGETQTYDPALYQQPAINLDADLRVGYVATVNSLNPFLCTDRDLVNLNMLTFESLVELDEESKPSPMLADSWTNEGTKWTFKLRDGVVFHNGAELTAADVLLSYQAFVAAGETNPYYARVKLIESMEATSADTVTVTSEYEGYITLYAMTFPVVQMSTLNDVLARGTGPYWYTEYVAGVGLRLEANPLWWKNDAKVHSIAAINYADSGDALEALHTRQVDMLCTRSDNASFSRRLSEYTSMDYLTNTYEMIVPNLNESSVMSDVRMRQAIMYAIDRAAIASNAYLGMGIQCEVPVNPSSWLYESQSAIYYYSPERALQLIQSCGWSDVTGDGIMDKVDGVRLVELELHMLVYNESTNSIRENAANMIAEYLRQVGIRVNIEVRGRDRALRYINEGNYDIALVSVNLSDVPTLTRLFKAGGSLNMNNYGNEAMQGYLELVPAAKTEEELKSLYSQIQMNVVERLPVLGLLFRTGTVLSRRSLAGLSGIREGNTLNGIEFMTLE